MDEPTNSTITVEQALNELRSQEYASQITALTERVAVERVRNLQLEQKVNELRRQNEALLLQARPPEPADDEGDEKVVPSDA